MKIRAALSVMPVLVEMEPSVVPSPTCSVPPLMVVMPV